MKPRVTNVCKPCPNCNGGKERAAVMCVSCCATYMLTHKGSWRCLYCSRKKDYRAQKCIECKRKERKELAKTRHPSRAKKQIPTVVPVVLDADTRALARWLKTNGDAAQILGYRLIADTLAFGGHVLEKQLRLFYNRCDQAGLLHPDFRRTHDQTQK